MKLNLLKKIFLNPFIFDLSEFPMKIRIVFLFLYIKSIIFFSNMDENIHIIISIRTIIRDNFLHEFDFMNLNPIIS